MKQNLAAVVIALLFSQQVAAQYPLTREARAAFREAVEDYQVFVVPRCAPDEVRAYVTARADRDRAFVRSLSNTKLKADYKQAVAHRAARDRNTVYHCSGPPPPPPPSPARADLLQPTPAQTKPRQHDTLAEHFAGGDRRFETMIQRRDAAIGSPSK